MIRRGIAFGIAATLAALLALFSLAVYGSTRATLYAGVDADLESRAAFLQRSWERLRLAIPMPTIPGGASALDPMQEARAAFALRLLRPRVFDAKGKSPLGKGDRPFSAPSLTSALRGRRTLETIRIENHPVRLLSTPLPGSGAVQLASDLAPAEDAVARLGVVCLSLLPLGAAVAGLLSIWITGRALRPVRAIAAAAGRIEAANLSARLPAHGRDEFADLGRAFNATFDRLEASFGALSRAMETQRRFTADASHELKTPLTAIKGRVGVALAGPQTPERYREHTIAVGRAADAMAVLVSNLLLLASADEGHLPVSPTRFSVREALDAMVGLLPPARPVEIEVDPGSVLCADRSLFQRAVLNLLDNAVRHTASGGRVVVRASPLPDALAVEVEDGGEGMSPEAAARAFDRFFRAEASRDRASGGTGLGLAIVLSIAEAHGGSVALESKPGVGTRVRLTFPQASQLGCQPPSRDLP